MVPAFGVLAAIRDVVTQLTLRSHMPGGLQGVLAQHPEQPVGKKVLHMHLIDFIRHRDQGRQQCCGDRVWIARGFLGTVQRAKGIRIMIAWPNKAFGTDRIAVGQAVLAQRGGQAQGIVGDFREVPQRRFGRHLHIDHVQFIGQARGGSANQGGPCPRRSHPEQVRPRLDRVQAIAVIRLLQPRGHRGGDLELRLNHRQGWHRASEQVEQIRHGAEELSPHQRVVLGAQPMGHTS